VEGLHDPCWVVGSTASGATLFGFCECFGALLRFLAKCMLVVPRGAPDGRVSTFISFAVVLVRIACRGHAGCSFVSPKKIYLFSLWKRRNEKRVEPYMYMARRLERRARQCMLRHFAASTSLRFEYDDTYTSVSQWTACFFASLATFPKANTAWMRVV